MGKKKLKPYRMYIHNRTKGIMIPILDWEVPDRFWLEYRLLSEDEEKRIRHKK